MNVLAVGAGGFLGALLRYGLGEWTLTRGGFPAGTLAVNLIGCLALGWLLTSIGTKKHYPERVRLFLSVGIIGSFTSLSTFSVEALELLQSQQFGFAALYASATAAGCLAMTAFGVGIARRIRKAGARGD